MVQPVNTNTGTIGAKTRVTRKISTATEWATGANFDLFVITGGPIIVRYLYAVVTTAFGAGAAVPQLNYTSTAGTVATVMDLAMATIANDVAGSLYVWTGAVGVQMAPAAALGHADTAEFAWSILGQAVLAPGTINVINAVAGADGFADWLLSWIPLRTECAVTAQ